MRGSLSIVVGGRDVSGGGGPFDVDVFAALHVVVLHARPNSEGVSTKVVSLSLDEVGREGLDSVAVKEGKLEGFISAGYSLEGITSLEGTAERAPLTAVVCAAMGIPQRVD